MRVQALEPTASRRPESSVARLWRISSSAPTAATAPRADRAHRRLPRSAKGCTQVRLRVPVRAARRLLPGPRRRLLRLRPARARVIGCGRDSFELTGLRRSDVIGRAVERGARPALRGRRRPRRRPSLEWGVRVLGKPVEVNAEGDLPASATADLFPAYDDDGGLLVVFTPRSSPVLTGSLAHDRPPPQPLHPAGRARADRRLARGRSRPRRRAWAWT